MQFKPRHSIADVLMLGVRNTRFSAFLGSTFAQEWRRSAQQPGKLRAHLLNELVGELLQLLGNCET
jgi:hypothetical protein